MRLQPQWDVIIVGGGHDGLVAAGYLGRRGLKVLLLERRSIVGGLCVTEELFPGFRGNTVTNSAHNLDPQVVVDLELEKFGLKFAYPDPSAFMAFPDGRAFVSYGDSSRRAGELAKFSKKDVTGYPALIEYIGDLAKVLNVSFYEPPPTFAALASRLKTPQQEEAFSKIFFGNVADLVDEFLDSPELKSAITITALLTNMAGPYTPGSPLPLLQRPFQSLSARGGGGGSMSSKYAHLGASKWSPLGGMGGVTEALRRSAEASGAVVMTSAAVSKVKVAGGRVTGVVTEEGEEFDGSIVVANVNPKIALLQFLDPADLEGDFRKKVQALSMVGQSSKIHVALDRLPRFKAAKSEEENVAFGACGFRVAPSVAEIDQCFRDAQDGRSSEIPIIWGQIPSAVDPTLTPPSKHLLSLSVWFTPYELAEGRTWEVEKTLFMDRCLRSLNDYIEDFDSIVLDANILSPKDLEDKFGLLGGQGTHGEITPGRYFSMRPVSGWSDYRTPVTGLYLTGAGTWPGNFLSGISGMNVTKAVLHDMSDMDETARRIELRKRADVDDDIFASSTAGM